MDQVSWERLYSEYADRVFAYARRRVGVQDAPDVMAETFLAAWRHREAMPPDALPWLYGVARNVIAHSRRTARRREALRERLTAIRGTFVCDPSPQVDEHAVVLSALKQLPPMEREALMLVTWEDLEPHRAAAALGCSAATLRVRLHRGRRRLRDLLAADRVARGPLLGPTLQEAGGSKP